MELKDNIQYSIDDYYKSQGTREPNIFELFFFPDCERIKYVNLCVDKYRAYFGDDRVQFIKEYMVAVLTVYGSEIANIDDPVIPERKIDFYMKKVSFYSTDTNRFLHNAQRRGCAFENLQRFSDRPWSANGVIAEFLSREYFAIKNSCDEKQKDASTEANNLIRIISGIYGKSIRKSIKKILIKDVVERSMVINALNAEDSEGSYDISIEDEDDEEDISEMDILMLEESEELMKSFDLFLKEYTPKKIIEFLDTRILGQSEAKKACAIFLYDHILRSRYPEKKIKSDALLVYGPSGSGKTEIWRALREISPVPIEIIDGGAITTRGFKGAELSTIITDILCMGDIIDDVSRKYSILVIDEFDKLVMPNSNAEMENVSLHVQSSLLQVLEDGVMIGENGNTIRAEHMGFVCVGAFSGLGENSIRRTVGFNSDTKTGMSDEIKDLLNYGMMPDLARRIGVISKVDKLSLSDYIKIIETDSMSPVRFLRELYSIRDINVTVPRASIEAIAELAYKSDLGAGKLLGIMKQAAGDKYIEALEENGNKEIIITRKDIERVAVR